MDLYPKTQSRVTRGFLVAVSTVLLQAELGHTSQGFANEGYPLYLTPVDIDPFTKAAAGVNGT